MKNRAQAGWNSASLCPVKVRCNMLTPASSWAGDAWQVYLCSVKGPSLLSPGGVGVVWTLRKLKPSQPQHSEWSFHFHSIHARKRSTLAMVWLNRCGLSSRLSNTINLSLRPLNVPSVDEKKTFELVSHQSILVAAARQGVPPQFFGYICELYSNVVTTLTIAPKLSSPFRLGWATLWSSTYLMLWLMCLAGLDPILGCRVWELRVNHGPFANTT